MRDITGKINPILIFLYYIIAIILPIAFINPYITVGVFVMVVFYAILAEGKYAIKRMLGYIPLFIVISLINPIVSTYGDSVLFTYLNGRSFTKEALFYGMFMGGIFLIIMLIFNRYNAYMTRDRLIYIFGRILPKMSMVVVIALRYVPLLKNRYSEITSARRAIGRGYGNERFGREKEGTNGMQVLTTWTLEDSSITSMSMKSRGYELSGKTSYMNYSMKWYDWIILVIGTIIVAVIFILGFTNKVGMVFYPVIAVTDIDLKIFTVILGILIFYFIPVAIHIYEKIESLWISRHFK